MDDGPTEDCQYSLTPYQTSKSETEWEAGAEDHLAEYHLIAAHALELLALDMQIHRGSDPIHVARGCNILTSFVIAKRLAGINHNSFIYAATVVTILSADCALA